jgi:DNA-binding SARP family transcriptional activator
VAEGHPEALEQAATLYRGDLLLGFTLDEPLFEEWLRAERERLREAALEALARLLAHQSKAGATDRAIQTALRLLALDPLQEAGHRALMRLYARQGRRAAALKQYQVCVGALQRELGMEPEAETRQLYLSLLRERSSPAELAAYAAPGEAEPPRLPPILASEPPLVGRDAELALLRQLLEAAVLGRGQAVMVVGQAGIGKSRLVSALAGDTIARGGQAFVGYGHESDSILPFGPWIDALRRAPALRDPPLLDRLGVAARAELSRILPELTAPGLPAPSGSNLRLFESVARLLEIAAGRFPVALVLEDVHWADEMTLRLLAFVARRIRDWRAVLVVTAREEDLVETSAVRRTVQEIVRDSGSVKLSLEPLGRDDTVRLVRSLGRVAGSGNAADRLEEQVWALAEGNPFVVVETVRAIQDGTVLPGAGVLALPERVRELIDGRLDRLSRGARELASVAAVIGREFDFRLLERAASAGEADAAEAVEELVRRRVLRGVGEQLDFTHDRLRRHVVEQLLAPQRMLHHRRIGLALEGLHRNDPSPPYLSLATHFRDGEVWDKAVGFFRLAAGQATARSASRDAVASIDEALAALAHLPSDADVVRLAIDLRTDQQSGYLLLGELPRMLASLKEAEALAHGLGDERRQAHVWAHEAVCCWWMGRLDEAVSYNRCAQTMAAALADAALAAMANSRLALALTYLGDYWAAIDVLERSLGSLTGARRLERFEMPVLPSVCDRGYLSLCLATVGNFEGAARTAREAVEIATEANHPYSIALGRLAMGRWSLQRGDFGAAIPWLEQCLESCRLDGFYVLPTVATCLGEARTLGGRAHEAIPLLEEAVERGPAMGFVASLPKSLTALGEAYLAAGRIDDAIRTVGRALDESRASKQRGFAVEAFCTLGEIHARQGGAEAAEHSYRQALDLAEELGMRPLAARAHLGLGRLDRAHPDQPRGGAHLTAARRMFGEMGMDYWPEQAEAESGAVP